LRHHKNRSHCRLRLGDALVVASALIDGSKIATRDKDILAIIGVSFVSYPF
jgi:hypothetical protein